MASTALYLAARQDVKKLFQESTSVCAKLNVDATQVALSKGILIKSPIVSIPQAPHMVEKPSYIGSVFGQPRPLHVISLMHLFLSIQENTLYKVLVTGFSQVARDPELKKFFLRGAEIGMKHIEVFGSLMREEDIPVPVSPDSMLTNSTISPFSDKLMLNHVVLANQFGIADIGIAAGQSSSVDIAADYLRLGTEVLQYGEDGVNISIKNGWMEAPPQVVRHRELALSGKSK